MSDEEGKSVCPFVLAHVGQCLAQHSACLSCFQRGEAEGENVKVGTGITATDEMHIEKLLKGTRSPQ